MKTPDSDSGRAAVAALFASLIAAWNARDAAAYARCFATEGSAVGFDGSQMDGAREIERALAGVFKGHPTASYVTITREVRRIGDDAFLLRAVAGMVPPGQTRIKPEVNAIQSLVAQRSGSEFKVVLFQNTPAAFHGRPEAAEALTRELQTEYEKTGTTQRSAN